MNKNHSLKWFIFGFAATGLVVILGGLLLSPTTGRAQEGDEDPPNNLAWALGETEPGSGRTDDPAGRRQIPIQEEETLPPNNPVQGQESGSFTDRILIPFSEEVPLPDHNLVAGLAQGGVFDPAGNQANQMLETELLTRAADRYISPLVIPAADFAPDGANPDSHFFPFGGGYFQGDSENYGCLVAPAYLPNGATVTDMFVSTYDNDATYNIFVNLRRADNFNGGATTMATANTTGEFAGVQVINDFMIDDPVVVYPDYSYYVTTCLLSGNIRLYSVRLYYDEQ